MTFNYWYFSSSTINGGTGIESATTTRYIEPIKNKKARGHLAILQTIKVMAIYIGKEYHPFSTKSIDAQYFSNSVDAISFLFSPRGERKPSTRTKIQSLPTSVMQTT